MPRLSGIHRFACLALYRALLRQCAKLPTTALDADVKILVQQKFHRYRNLQSPSQTSNALKAGYEALDLLHSASQGHRNDVDRITTLISHSRSMKQENASMQRALTAARPPKPLSPKQRKKEEAKRFQASTAGRHPDAAPILSRPRPVVRGRRRVPVLVSARGIPFLRIKKPQPMVLSGVIRSKLETRWRRVEHREMLNTELLFARDEDMWDKLTTGGEPATWIEAVEISLKEVSRLIKVTDYKNKQLAEAMWKIVLAERKLAAEEESRDRLTEKQS